MVKINRNSCLCIFLRGIGAICGYMVIQLFTPGPDDTITPVKMLAVLPQPVSGEP